jgi:hypothetical protein
VPIQHDTLHLNVRSKDNVIVLVFGMVGACVATNKRAASNPNSHVLKSNRLQLLSVYRFLFISKDIVIPRFVPQNGVAARAVLRLIQSQILCFRQFDQNH